MANTGFQIDDAYDPRAEMHALLVADDETPFAAEVEEYLTGISYHDGAARARELAAEVVKDSRNTA